MYRLRFRAKKMFIRLAWKNIWRNKKRTIIVSASIFFAVIMACIMRSLQIGSFEYMINSIAKIHLGYLQIQQTDFREKRSLDNSFAMADSEISAISKIKYITSVTPRLESFALISNDTLTQVAQIVGIDPDNEDKTTNLKSRLVEGSYLNKSDHRALISSGIAKKLKLSIGDTLLVFGLGYHGQTAAALVPVQGILKFPIENMNKMLIYFSLQNAQNIFLMPEKITSAVVTIDQIYHLEDVSKSIKQRLPDDLQVLSWDELMPEIKQMITMKTSSNLILIAILYIVIAFGIFGVIMMMAIEREKEYGILFALGMKKTRMIFISALESIFMASIGTLSGIIAALPITFYFSNNPIRVWGKLAKSWEQLGIEPVLTFSSDPDIFIYQAIIVFVITSVCMIYPLFFIGRLEIIRAMKK